VIFCTPWFLVFSFAVAALYLAVRPWATARLLLMLAASIVFYFQFAGLTGFLIIISLATLTYFSGRHLANRVVAAPAPPTRLLAWCLAPAVLALVYFRYYDFLTATVADATTWLGLTSAPAWPWLQSARPVLVPLGISFFAFEFCHYLVDVYHGGKPVRNPLHFALFALFYPRLASGPIVRYQQIVPQLEQLPAANLDDVSQGLLRISVGFAKKFLLADPAAQLVATSFQPSAILAGTDVLWLCLLLYIRIYLDFGGYCDMAIGLARLWGIKLPENFNFPFLAASPSTFWRRWHMTLSTWIRDYIYIPLGGGRVPAWRKGLNLLFAMALCGLWHGSAWNFVLWGALHGLALQVGHGLTALCDWLARIGPANPWARRGGAIVATLLGWGLTQSFVGLTWILFFFPAADAWHVISQLRLLL
jgi:alginate O-acetyltransferase complex protein AlgI